MIYEGIYRYYNHSCVVEHNQQKNSPRYYSTLSGISGALVLIYNVQPFTSPEQRKRQADESRYLPTTIHCDAMGLLAIRAAMILSSLHLGPMCHCLQ